MSDIQEYIVVDYIYSIIFLFDSIRFQNLSCRVNIVKMYHTKFMEIYVFYMATYSQALGRASLIFIIITPTLRMV